MKELAIETQHLSFSFDNLQVVKDLSLKVPQNAIYGFLGPNGAGKTTTIKLLLGLLKCEKQKVYYLGQEFHQHKYEILAQVGALVEKPSLYAHLSAWDNLQYLDILFRKGKRRIMELLELVGLTEAAHKKVKNFSSGMKQRLGIAWALFHDPQILILDEPTNGLDPSGIQEIRELLKQLQAEHQKTVFVSSHLLSEVEKTCTHIGIIQEGELVFQGEMDNLLAKSGQKVTLKTNSPQEAQLLCHNHGLRASIDQRNLLELNLPNEKEFSRALRLLALHDIDIYSVTQNHGTLEDLFMQITKK